MNIFHRTPKSPWKKYYGKVEKDIVVPDISMYQLIKNRAEEVPNYNAIDYVFECIIRIIRRQTQKCKRYM
jgi:hypothetical protein